MFNTVPDKDGDTECVKPIDQWLPQDMWLDSELELVTGIEIDEFHNQALWKGYGWSESFP